MARQVGKASGPVNTPVPEIRPGRLQCENLPVARRDGLAGTGMGVRLGCHCPEGSMIRFLASFIGLLLLAAPAFPACQGKNLIASLSDQDRAALTAAADAVPFPRGMFWRATRGTAIVHLIGTYHFDDPRHAPTFARLEPLIAHATTVLVEAGPDEQKALFAHMARDPSVMVITDGPTLPEMLPEADWQALADAMRARSMPPFMAAKFRPWYVSMILSTPACDMENMTASTGGLDAMVIKAAQQARIPIRALEPYDTIFSIFGALTQDEQISMIRSTLAMEPMAADYAVTLADSYFAEEGRLLWEFTRFKALSVPGETPETVARDFSRMEEVLMAARNRAWIPVIDETSRQGPVLVAFGALHLSGAEGVLALLERAGFVIERLPL